MRATWSASRGEAIRIWRVLRSGSGVIGHSRILGDDRVGHAVRPPPSDMGRAGGKTGFVEGKMGDRGGRFLRSAHTVERRALRRSAVGQGAVGVQRDVARAGRRQLAAPVTSRTRPLKHSARCSTITAGERSGTALTHPTHPSFSEGFRLRRDRSGPPQPSKPDLGMLHGSFRSDRETCVMNRYTPRIRSWTFSAAAVCPRSTLARLASSEASNRRNQSSGAAAGFESRGYSGRAGTNPGHSPIDVRQGCPAGP